MPKDLAIVAFFLILNEGKAGHVEPTCSKYDFEEKVLEKVVRFEHKMELFTDSIEKIAAKVEENLERMQKAQDKLQSETGAIWVEIKSHFGSLKRNVEEQTSAMNGTIYSQLSSFKKSFDDIAASIQGPSYAFSAYDLSKASNLNTGTILIFAKTQINENNVYSTATGKFTAPADGIYVFHATLHISNSQKRLWVEFHAGGQVAGRFMLGDNNYESSSSGSATAQLLKGAEVYIEVTSVYSGISFREDRYGMSTFSGHLLSI